jgi:hypothetical protein
MCIRSGAANLGSDVVDTIFATKLIGMGRSGKKFRRQNGLS